MNHIHFKVVRGQTEMTHQQRLSRSGSRVIKRAVGESRQHPPLALMLEDNILSACSNKNDMWHISLSVTRVCRYSVNHFWVDACVLQYEFVVVNSQTTKYWILQDSVATVLRRDGLNYMYNHLCPVSSWCSVPRIKISKCFTKLFKK